LTREELRECLLQLNGLNRVTAGWDMITLNWIITTILQSLFFMPSPILSSNPHHY
jgi:hypothetical protein